MPEPDASPEQVLAEKIRRELRMQVRTTMQDMAVAISNSTGCPHSEALAYLVAEAKWVEAYYAQQATAADRVDAGEPITAIGAQEGAVIGGEVL